MDEIWDAAKTFIGKKEKIDNKIIFIEFFLENNLIILSKTSIENKLKKIWMEITISAIFEGLLKINFTK